MTTLNIFCAGAGQAVVSRLAAEMERERGLHFRQAGLCSEGQVLAHQAVCTLEQGGGLG